MEKIAVKNVFIFDVFPFRHYLTKDIPVGFIEARDIGDKDLEGKKKGKAKALPFGMNTPCIYIIVINTIVIISR